jgi:hypothetical protein
MGLNRETSKYLNLAFSGSFLHTPTPKARELLLKISQTPPMYEAKPQETLEERILDS